MNTTENNKIIAEFMGLETETFTQFSDRVKADRKNGIVFTSNKCLIEDSNYHTNWDSLMEVVEKIESLKINKFAKQLGREDVKPIEGHFWFQTITNVVEIYASVYYWQYDNQIKGLSQRFKAETKIEAVYVACVEFVKWYNKNSGIKN